MPERQLQRIKLHNQERILWPAVFFLAVMVIATAALVGTYLFPFTRKSDCIAFIAHFHNHFSFTNFNSRFFNFLTQITYGTHILSEIFFNRNLIFIFYNIQFFIYR